MVYQWDLNTLWSSMFYMYVLVLHWMVGNYLTEKSVTILIIKWFLMVVKLSGTFKLYSLLIMHNCKWCIGVQADIIHDTNM